MATKAEDRKDKKERLLQYVRLYAEETRTGAYIKRSDFNHAVVEADIGTSKVTKATWWDAFISWGILIIPKLQPKFGDGEKRAIVNPEFMRDPREKMIADRPGATIQEGPRLLNVNSSSDSYTYPQSRRDSS